MQSWGRLQEPRFWHGGWHTGLIQWLVLFAVVHPGQHCPPQTFLPVSRARGVDPGRCGVPRRGRAGAARARGVDCCWPSGLLLRVCTGGWTRRGSCARDGLLASVSAGLLGFPQLSWVRSAGRKPDTGGSSSRNRLYTLAAAAAWWLPPGRRSQFASLLAGSYLPMGSLWACPMPTKKARVSGKKPLQRFRRAPPGQPAIVGGLMAPGGWALGTAQGFAAGQPDLPQTALSTRPAARFFTSRGP